MLIRLPKEMYAMPISGLVITLSEEPQDQAAALSALADDARMEVGEIAGRRVPIVVDTATSEEDQHVWEWLHKLRGVQFVEVACIHFDDEHHMGHAQNTEVLP